MLLAASCAQAKDANSVDKYCYTARVTLFTLCFDMCARVWVGGCVCVFGYTYTYIYIGIYLCLLTEWRHLQNYEHHAGYVLMSFGPPRSIFCIPSVSLLYSFSNLSTSAPLPVCAVSD